MKLLEQLVDLGTTLSLDRRSHERRRRLGDRATGPLEADVADSIAAQLEPDRELVTAERVSPLGVAIGIVHPMKVARRPIVLQDHILIERAELHHPPNTCFTRWIPRTKASTSSRVLYTANEARAVAATPKCAITGCAQ